MTLKQLASDLLWVLNEQAVSLAGRSISDPPLASVWVLTPEHMLATAPGLPLPLARAVALYSGAAELRHCTLGLQLIAGDWWADVLMEGHSRMARSWRWPGFRRSGTSPTFLKIRSIKRATLFNNYIYSFSHHLSQVTVAWMFWPFASLCHGSELIKTAQNLHWPMILANLSCCPQSAHGFH